MNPKKTNESDFQQEIFPEKIVLAIFFNYRLKDELRERIYYNFRIFKLKKEKRRERKRVIMNAYKTIRFVIKF